jgi:hypothetical protein
LLNDGGIATYDATHSTPTALVFDYAIGQGQNTPDLSVGGIRLGLQAAIRDLAGNYANLFGSPTDLGVGINTPAGASTGPAIGNFTVSGTQQLELFGSSNATLTLTAGSTGTIKLDDPTAFGGTIGGLTPSNHLDLVTLAYQGNSTPTYTPNAANTAGTLTVTEGAQAVSIALVGSYSAGSFVASNDGHGGTFVTDPAKSAF